MKLSWWIKLPHALLRRPGRCLAVAGLLLVIGAGAAVAGLASWATHHRRAGRAALERYHTDEAVPHLQAALTVWPRDAETLLLAARAARRSGSFDEADQFLDRYQDVRGRDDADLILERVLVRAERGEVDSVARFCRALLDRDDPATFLVLEALAKGELRAYRPVGADAAVEEWLKRQPDNPQALLIRGQVHELRERRTDAIVAYRRALEVDASLDEARMRLCPVLMEMGLAQEARPHLEYLHRRYPGNPMVQVLLARARDRQGDAEAAEKILDDVLSQRPHFAPALAERGKLARRAGRWAEAETLLREAVSLEPGDYPARYQLAQCLENNGKADEAQKEHDRLRQLEDDMKRSQEIAAGRLEAEPHNAQLHYEMGMISLRAGAVAEGLRWLHSALKEDPNHAAAHEALREHYQKVGDFGRARQHRSPDKGTRG